MWTWPNLFLTTKRLHKETISNYEGLKPLPCPAAHSRIGHTREYHPPRFNNHWPIPLRKSLVVRRIFLTLLFVFLVCSQSPIFP